MNRLALLSSQITVNQTAGLKGQYMEQRSKNKLDWFKHNGWGFKDTEFIIEDEKIVKITGSRYQFSNEKMPKFIEWAQSVVGIDINLKSPAQLKIPIDPPIVNQQFIEEVKKFVEEISLDDSTRIQHSHGHSLQEIYTLRYGKFARTVDAVIFINSNQQAVDLVRLAVQHNVALIPYGGGTNVTWALKCVETETRMICSVDVTRMNHVRWVDRKNMTALVEAGIIGRDLEKELSRYGVCCGHEPDSVEFSSLGGWISTRASGMKKNRYGNIEDIVLQIQIVTPSGILKRTMDSCRLSSGPDIDHLIMGHEGTLGLITEAVIKVKPLPKVQVYDSIIFHNFNSGTQFMYDVSQSKVWPASIRLVDNQQFKFGMALKTEPKNKKEEFLDRVKKFFVTKVMKFNPDEMCLLTILFEGSQEEVQYQQTKIYDLAKKHKGFRAGSENGKRGYFLTFMIAYLRDFAFQFYFVAESFETSVSWKNVPTLCDSVKRRMIEDCRKLGVQKEPYISFRISQVYDTGAAVYVYFGFPYYGLENPLEIYGLIEDGAREEIMKQGGSISHHHGINFFKKSIFQGVGKLRKQFLTNSIGETGVQLLTKIKAQIDPQNIFASNNLV